MTSYVVAQVKIKSRVLRQVPLSFRRDHQRFDGRVLAADESAVAAEGEWHYDKLVLLEFPRDDDLVRWAGSPEYQEILVHRLAGTDTLAVVAHGPPAAPAY